MEHTRGHSSGSRSCLNAFPASSFLLFWEELAAWEDLFAEDQVPRRKILGVLTSVPSSPPHSVPICPSDSGKAENALANPVVHTREPAARSRDSGGAPAGSSSCPWSCWLDRGAAASCASPLQLHPLLLGTSAHLAILRVLPSHRPACLLRVPSSLLRSLPNLRW